MKGDPRGRAFAAGGNAPRAAAQDALRTRPLRTRSGRGAALSKELSARLPPARPLEFRARPFSAETKGDVRTRTRTKIIPGFACGKPRLGTVLRASICTFTVIPNNAQENVRELTSGSHTCTALQRSRTRSTPEEASGKGAPVRRE